MFAEFVSAIGGTVEHWRAHDGCREVGRIKPDPPNTVWLDITKGSVMETQRDMMGKRK